MREYRNIKTKVQAGSLLISLICVISLVPCSISFAELTGQIVRDPLHLNRMVYHNTYVDGHLKPCFFAGPGDPEDFFYYNTAGNKSFLISKGARCTYITAYLQDFGGGNPGTGSALDATLNTWETHITDLENAGIITVFFFYDDMQSRPAGWETDVAKIVNKFEHHKLLIWSVAEEYGEALNTTIVSEVASLIKSTDDNNHIVGVHQNHSSSFDFNGDSNLEMFLIQYNTTDPATLYNAMISAYLNTGGVKILNMSEAVDHAKRDRTTVRKLNWASAMGACSAVQVLWMGRATDDALWNTQEKYDDCATLTDFMENTNLNVTTPRSDLEYDGTEYLMADPTTGNYIAYSSALSGNLGVQGITAGHYDFTWVDCVTGTIVEESAVSVSAGNQSWVKPGTIGSELAFYISEVTEAGPPDHVGVEASPASLVANGSSTSEITATIKDSSGVPCFLSTDVITFSASGEGTLIGTTAEAASSGVVVTTLQSTTSLGTATVTATSAGLTQGSVNVDTIIGPPAKINNSANPTLITNNGVSISTITASICDSMDRTVTTATNLVSFSLSSETYAVLNTLTIPPLSVTNLWVASGLTYEVIDLGVGDTHYTDRVYTIASIPAGYEGLTWIRTANDDKASTANPFLNFDVNIDVTVYVGLVSALT